MRERNVSHAMWILGVCSCCSIERVRSYTLRLLEGVGGGVRFTYYHLVLKESIQLQKGVFCLFNIMFVLWMSSGMMFVNALV